MLAKLVADIPPGLYYEPKWDGFRAIVVRDGDSIEILSRNGKPMARYFPDLIAAFRAQLPSRCTVDGEIVVIGGDRLDFFALQQRVHPAASRVDRLAGETPASFIAFDLLDAPDEPFRARRAGLEAMGWAPPLFITPITRDEAVARDWFERFEGAGLDGVIAKDGELPYKPGVRAMFKVKHQRTVDCVVAGYRLHKTEPNAIGSLLLGLHQDGHGPAWGTMFGGLMPIGATSSFPMARRRELLVELRELEIPIADHPWQGAAEHGRDGNRWNPAREQQFVALAPERVIEVAYTHMDGGFFRHPATFVRWRPDRDAASCGFAQLEQPVASTSARSCEAPPGDRGGGAAGRRPGAGPVGRRVGGSRLRSVGRDVRSHGARLRDQRDRARIDRVGAGGGSCRRADSARRAAPPRAVNRSGGASATRGEVDERVHGATLRARAPPGITRAGERAHPPAVLRDLHGDDVVPLNRRS